jgi:2-haloacid dehalogenase
MLGLLKKEGLRMALLSNFTPHMLNSCVKSSGLATLESILSTDQVREFKPDPRAYEMGAKSFNVRFEQNQRTTETVGSERL